MIPHFSPARDDKIKLRLRAVAMKRTVTFAFRNPNEREIEGMASDFRQDNGLGSGGPTGGHDSIDQIYDFLYGTRFTEL